MTGADPGLSLVYLSLSIIPRSFTSWLLLLSISMLYFLSMELLMPKKQEEPALLGQEDSAGTGRRGWGVTASHAEGHAAWGNSLGQHCPLGNVQFPASSSGEEELWGKSPAMAVLADALNKGFWRQPGAPVQLSSIKGGEGKRNSYVLFPGWMEELVTRHGDLCRKCLKPQVWSSTQKWGPHQWGPQSLGSSSLGPELKTEVWLSPKPALKKWEKQLVLLHLRTCRRGGSRCLRAWQEHGELFLINNMDKSDEHSHKYLLLAAFKDSSFPCCLF